MGGPLCEKWFLQGVWRDPMMVSKRIPRGDYKIHTRMKAQTLCSAVVLHQDNLGVLFCFFLLVHTDSLNKMKAGSLWHSCWFQWKNEHRWYCGVVMATVWCYYSLCSANIRKTPFTPRNDWPKMSWRFKNGHRLIRPFSWTSILVPIYMHGWENQSIDGSMCMKWVHGRTA